MNGEYLDINKKEEIHFNVGINSIGIHKFTGKGPLTGLYKALVDTLQTYLTFSNSSSMASLSNVSSTYFSLISFKRSSNFFILLDIDKHNCFMEVSMG